jgi:hypothetical protein
VLQSHWKFTDHVDSNILMAVFRVRSLALLNINKDLTYDVIPVIIVATGQCSTAIILTCCPLLRPLFEKIVPKRLTLIRSSRHRGARPGSVRDPASIRVTRTIDVLPETSTLRIQNSCHDGFEDPDGPKFEVARPQHRNSPCPWV